MTPYEVSAKPPSTEVSHGTIRRMAINQMQHEIWLVNTEKGWYDEDVPFFTAMALLHSEVSEAVEAYRNWGTADATSKVIDQGEHGPDALPKPEGVGSEFADILIRLLDDCERWGIDLAAEYERKIAFNRTREYRHGGKRA
jgi:NTP pyrophosphatase (non-canonical NTP hydrolase)